MICPSQSYCVKLLVLVPLLPWETMSGVTPEKSMTHKFLERHKIYTSPGKTPEAQSYKTILMVMWSMALVPNPNIPILLYWSCRNEE